MVENPELHAILHRLWTKAVGTADYNKEEWIELEQRILSLQLDASKAGSPDTEQLIRIANALEAMGGAPWGRKAPA